ncbi:hypothetical protein [Vibrio harveyi]|uniref:hypothetical protein n=1 Tax=Vibrio harveyi TaxID=669 RepID=UPI0023806FFA|nr:hypothetical protein [Vibrio harveyi]
MTQISEINSKPNPEKVKVFKKHYELFEAVQEQLEYFHFIEKFNGEKQWRCLHESYETLQLDKVMTMTNIGSGEVVPFCEKMARIYFEAVYFSDSKGCPKSLVLKHFKGSFEEHDSVALNRFMNQIGKHDTNVIFADMNALGNIMVMHCENQLLTEQLYDDIRQSMVALELILKVLKGYTQLESDKRLNQVVNLIEELLNGKPNTLVVYESKDGKLLLKGCDSAWLIEDDKVKNLYSSAYPKKDFNFSLQGYRKVTGSMLVSDMMNFYNNVFLPFKLNANGKEEYRVKTLYTATQVYKNYTVLDVEQVEDQRINRIAKHMLKKAALDFEKGTFNYDCYFYSLLVCHDKQKTINDSVVYLNHELLCLNYAGLMNFDIDNDVVFACAMEDRPKDYALVDCTGFMLSKREGLTFANFHEHMFTKEEVDMIRELEYELIEQQIEKLTSH